MNTQPNEQHFSPKLKGFFDWYLHEKPSWERVLDKQVELTWHENHALVAAQKHIARTVQHETSAGGHVPVELSTQEVFEQHGVWLRNLTNAQLGIWKDVPRS
jgi:hypothetical protein